MGIYPTSKVTIVITHALWYNNNSTVQYSVFNTVNQLFVCFILTIIIITINNRIVQYCTVYSKINLLLFVCFCLKLQTDQVHYRSPEMEQFPFQTHQKKNDHQLHNL